MSNIDIDPFCDCGDEPCSCGTWEAEMKAEREAQEKKWKEQQDWYNSLNAVEKAEYDKKMWDESLKAEEEWYNSLTQAQRDSLHEAESRDMTSLQHYVV